MLFSSPCTYSKTFIGAGQQHSGDRQPSTKSSCSGHDPPHLYYQSWKGWTIGSYVYAWRPAHPPDDSPCGGQRWRNHPVLLVDIRKKIKGEIEFTVAHLYDRHVAAKCLRGLARCARWRASVSLWTWPRECTYVLSDHLEIVNDTSFGSDTLCF